MKQRLGHRSIAVIAIAAITLAACGGGGSDDSADETDAPDTEETVADTEPADTEPADTEPEDTEPEDTEPTDTEPTAGIDSVQPSVIQIEAIGTIRDPEVGFTDGSGRGSGFIISDDGIAVTNNHVVTGAATLEVFIGGDTSESYNATVLGVSECNDLAVIDIDEDDPLPALQWYDDDITTGLDVYAAGFPLGDPEFTLTRGIVSKLEADGDTSWASIDSVLEHDAAIQPGNSGGPLVTTDAAIVGVNYAGGSPTNTEQFFAIDKDRAQEVVEKLMEGDFESIGVNGQVVVDEEAGIAGVWVAGVAPGSPADDAELLPGDIIQTMNGIPIGTDGTMADYCDVLRTSGDNPIQIEVLRFDTSEILTGEINGDEVLDSDVLVRRGGRGGDRCRRRRRGSHLRQLHHDHRRHRRPDDRPADGMDLARHRTVHLRRRFVAAADHRSAGPDVVLRDVGHAGHLLLARPERRHPPGPVDVRPVGCVHRRRAVRVPGRCVPRHLPAVDRLRRNRHHLRGARSLDGRRVPAGRGAHGAGRHRRRPRRTRPGVRHLQRHELIDRVADGTWVPTHVPSARSGCSRRRQLT